MKKFNRYEVGYLSAIIDGEGCISIAKYRRKDSNGMYYQIRLTIANNNLELLNYVKNIIDDGGYIITKKNKKYKDSYDLKYSHKTIRWILPQLNLIVKKEKAKKALKLLEVLKPTNRFCDTKKRDIAWKNI